MADSSISGANESDLIKHLVAFGVSAEDAKAALAADASSFQAVMETLLAKVFRISSTWLQPFYSYQPDLESPEAFDESISDWNFYTAVRDCLEKIGVNGFRWKDLHDPSAKQVKRHLLEIINFARFREWKEGKSDAMEDEIAGMADQNEELESDLTQLRREFEVACGDQDDREAHLLELEDVQNDEKSKLNSLTHEYESLLNELQRAEAAAAHAKQQVESMEAKRKGTLQALNKLRNNLCEDHDQVLAELASEKRAADEYQKESNAASNGACLLSKWLSEAKQIQQEVYRTMRMLDETLAAQEFEKNARQQLADVTEAVKTVEANINAGQARNVEQEKELQANLAKRTQELTCLKEEEAHADAQAACAKKQREHCVARVEMLQADVAEITQQVAASTKKLEDILLTREQRRGQCLAEYDAVPAAVSSLIVKVVSLLQSPLPGSTKDGHGGAESVLPPKFHDRVANLKKNARKLGSSSTATA